MHLLVCHYGFFSYNTFHKYISRAKTGIPTKTYAYLWLRILFSYVFFYFNTAILIGENECVFQDRAQKMPSIDWSKQQMLSHIDYVLCSMWNEFTGICIKAMHIKVSRQMTLFSHTIITIAANPLNFQVLLNTLCSMYIEDMNLAACIQYM